MPQIIYSEQATSDIVRVAEFIEEIEPRLKQKVIATLLEGIELLEHHPRIARPSEDERYKTMRELFIPFGKAGYLALYEYLEEKDIVLIAAIRHTRESGFKPGQ